MKELDDESHSSSYVEGTNDPLYAKRAEMYRQEIARIQQFITHGAVLDVGCGIGGFLRLFDHRMWRKYGIEISEFARDRALRRC